MSDAKKYTSKLTSRRILIIGGSSGIGYSVAEACLEHGATVIISSSSRTRVEASIERLLQTYPSAKDRLTGYTCDISSPDVEYNMTSLFENVGGKLDHIISTAGDKLATIPIQEATLAQMQQAGMVRFFGPLLIAKIGTPYLSPSSMSSITFTTGSVAEKPMPGWSVVASYAAGLHGMVRNLAIDLKPIRVNLVSPGAVATELWNDMPREEYAAFEKAVAGKVPTGAIGRPEDVAEAYVYAMKDGNLTGSVVNTNGGMLLV
ncbi:MAG: hypothetical protein M1830_009116 [Pleopsidium flavum]|nr:MAG: hypothetical protein M1830_009116 [Pleopsidium flavum]